ncbi:uncharacterized membrane protein YcaP (DUF421 family) [Orenia metallireducens]|uniref:Uncharacterized membrane protein YcaP, DUF421 family n=2 Tax=Orenia TaxID=46468 RepID=A0A285ICZ6_9FIRM|nr:DUF421 domain-containing protein [Orenia metallireducens]PRX20166.1 uncharacterized membrane protein YcaP (DUF421 family) [Orenia metallireducens]SNY45840.1 Uncharacterized membrane protein YcaP, DUF421 family [Orenia metallireducens]
MEIILKVFIMFILSIALTRFMGKSSIVQLTPYDLIAIITLGTIAAEPLISTKVMPSIISLIALVFFYVIFAKLTLNQKMNKLLLGEPTILIKAGKIVEDNLEKEHISLIQLLAILRNNGYSKLSEVNYAILEPTGNISIIPVSSARPVTLADLNIKAEDEGIPIALIIDGIVQKKNLRLVNKNQKWLKDKLEEEGIKDIRKVIYAFVESMDDQLYLSLR